MTSNLSLKDIGGGYIPTEEEWRLFAECHEECFWFRCELSCLRTVLKNVLGWFCGTCVCACAEGRRQ
jgi:hypothetical protein